MRLFTRAYYVTRQMFRTRHVGDKHVRGGERRNSLRFSPANKRAPFEFGPPCTNLSGIPNTDAQFLSFRRAGTPIVRAFVDGQRRGNRAQYQGRPPVFAYANVGDFFAETNPRKFTRSYRPGTVLVERSSPNDLSKNAKNIAGRFSRKLLINYVIFAVLFYIYYVNFSSINPEDIRARY